MLFKSVYIICPQTVNASLTLHSHLNVRIFKRHIQIITYLVTKCIHI